MSFNPRAVYISEEGWTFVAAGKVRHTPSRSVGYAHKSVTDLHKQRDNAAVASTQFCNRNIVESGCHGNNSFREALAWPPSSCPSQTYEKALPTCQCPEERFNSEARQNILQPTVCGNVMPPNCQDAQPLGSGTIYNDDIFPTGQAADVPCLFII